jgi:hypothetical protein
MRVLACELPLRRPNSGHVGVKLVCALPLLKTNSDQRQNREGTAIIG